MKAKIILVGGSSSLTMAKKSCQLCKSDPRVVILPTARGDDPEIIEETYGFYSKFSSRVDVLKLVKEKPSVGEVKQRILSADLIYVPGGDAYDIRNVWAQTGAEDAILEAVETEGKVLVGSSAGAMAFSLSCVEQGEKFSGYGIVPVWFTPHYQMEQYKRFDNFLNGKTYPTLAYAAGDDAGILCAPNGKYYTFFGEEGNSVWRFVFCDGKWKREEFGPAEDHEI